MTETCYIQIIGGVPENKVTLDKFYLKLPTGRYELRATRKNKRSLPQNAYFHGPLLDFVWSCLLDAGYNEFQNKDQVKSFLKCKFLLNRVINTETGELVGEYARDTRDLSKLEFNEFIENIAQMCAEYFNAVLPMPNEQLQAF